MRLMGSMFEAPVCLIDRQVELRFHPENLGKVEIFFQGRSHGFVQIVNPYINSQIGRDWKPGESGAKKSISEETADNASPSTGQLIFPKKKVLAGFEEFEGFEEEEEEFEGGIL